MLVSEKIIDKQIKLFMKFYKSYKKENWNNQVNLNRLKHTKKNVDYFYKILKLHLQTKTDITKLINKKKRATFYRTYNKIRNTFYSKKPDFNNLLVKSKRPNTFREFYTYIQRKEMCDTYYDPNNLHNKTSLWINFKRDKYNHLSLRIFIKYLNNDKRASLKPIKIAKIKHPRRLYDIPLGNIQMDIKIFDKRENPLKNQKLYLLDFIDEQSKFVYGEFLEHQTTDEILAVVKRAKLYFEQHGIKINRIRTDNAMVFKKTNFVYSGHFQNYLAKHQIRHEFIPLNEPECNGCIERFHATISQEFCPKIKNICDFTQAKIVLKTWLNFYNFERNHYYFYVKNKQFSNKFLTPFAMIFNNNFS